MRIATTALSLLTVAVLAGCSSTSSGDPTTGPSTSLPTVTSPSAPGSSTGSSPTSFPSSSSGTPTSGGLTEAQAQAALLTAAEIGSGFAQTPTDNSDTPLPCTPNAPTLAQRFPPEVKVEADFGGAGGKALFSEEIETFADAATVAQVIAAGEQGLSCGSATVGGAQVTISKPTQLTSQLSVPVDKAEAWSISSSVLNAAIAIVAIDNQLVVFSFGGDPSVDDSTLPDAQSLITSGLQKIQAALK